MPEHVIRDYCDLTGGQFCGIITTVANAWQHTRNRSGWVGGIVEWQEDNTAYLSVVFSWDLPCAYSRAIFLASQGYHVYAGGPAVLMNPTYLSGIVETTNLKDVIFRHNPNATFTSRGCIRKCKFCIVPKIEGDLVELNNWPIRPIICDNNLLACSKVHFDDVVDKLKSLSGVDFNQGLDARLLTSYHANRLAELDFRCIRLAWDHIKDEAIFRKAFQLLIDGGIPANMIRVYCLIGFDDTPEDALYRLETIRSLGALPNPMRYQPINTIQKNSYVSPNWTNSELIRYMRYWQNLRHTSCIPFQEFCLRNEPLQIVREQLSFPI